MSSSTYSGYASVSGSPSVRGQTEPTINKAMEGVSTLFNGVSSAASWVWDAKDYAPEFTRWTTFGLAMLGMMGAASKSGLFSLLGDHPVLQWGLGLAFALVVAGPVSGMIGDWVANTGADRKWSADGKTLLPSEGSQGSQQQGNPPVSGGYEKNQTGILNNQLQLGGTFTNAAVGNTPPPATQVASVPPPRLSPAEMYPDIAAIK